MAFYRNIFRANGTIFLSPAKCLGYGRPHFQRLNGRDPGARTVPVIAHL